MLIGLHGYQGSGKDTIASILSRYGFVRVAFADQMREALLRLDPLVTADGEEYERLSTVVELHGWDNAKRRYPEVRALLQRFGTEVGRGLWGENFWVNMGLREATKHLRAVITDVRFPNEAEAIKIHRGLLINVVRPGHGPRGDHASEGDLSHLCDLTIHNDGTVEDLPAKVGLAFLGAGFIR